MKEIKIVCFGEILWDNLQEGRRLGGAPLNVCYHLMKMGLDSTIITQIGNDRDGKDILAELDRLNIDRTFCFTSDTRPTSTVEVHVAAGHQVTYEIVENVAWDEIVTSPAMKQVVEASDAFVFGSLVTRSDTSRQSLFKLIECSRYRVFDVNLRAPYYDWKTIDYLLGKTNLLKLNEEELSKIIQWLGFGGTGFYQQLEFIHTRYPGIGIIILTRGADGALYYSKGQHCAIQAMKVDVKDTVGSGDAFLAAFLAGRFSGKSIGQTLEQANLLSGFIASQHGACPQYEMHDLLTFKESQQLLRN